MRILKAFILFMTVTIACAAVLAPLTGDWYMFVLSGIVTIFLMAYGIKIIRWCATIFDYEEDEKINEPQKTTNGTEKN